MKRHLSLALCVVAASSLLGGCGYLRTKFGSKPDVYKNASQTRPLEVPPDLDKPNSSGTLMIPDRNTGAASAGVSDVPASTSPASSGAGSTGDAIAVADSVASTWTRVGLALERSGAAAIESKDEATHSYAIKANATTTTRPGWFKRAITFGRADGKKVSTPVALAVRVSEDGAGSKVTVDGGSGPGAASAAREVLDVLRQRML